MRCPPDPVGSIRLSALLMMGKTGRKRNFFCRPPSLMEWTMITAVIAILAILFMPSFSPANQPRSKTSSVKSDQRTLASALEGYYVDHDAYPPAIRQNGDLVLGHHLTTPVPYLTEPVYDKFKLNHYPNIVSLVWYEWGFIIVLGFILMVIISMVLYTKNPDKWELGDAIRNIFLPGCVVLGFLIVLLFQNDETLVQNYNDWGYYKIRSEWRGKDLGFRYYSDQNGWILISLGPDGDYDIDPEKYYHSSIAQPSFELLCIAGTYDPTNGTVSSGDVFRVKQ